MFLKWFKSGEKLIFRGGWGAKLIFVAVEKILRVKRERWKKSPDLGTIYTPAYNDKKIKTNLNTPSSSAQTIYHKNDSSLDPLISF